jgi:hypothetical protein
LSLILAVATLEVEAAAPDRKKDLVGADAFRLMGVILDGHPVRWLAEAIAHLIVATLTNNLTHGTTMLSEQIVRGLSDLVCAEDHQPCAPGLEVLALVGPDDASGALRLPWWRNVYDVLVGVLERSSGRGHTAVAQKLYDVTHDRMRRRSPFPFHPDVCLVLRSGLLPRLVHLARTCVLAAKKQFLVCALCYLHRNIYSRFVEEELVPFLCASLREASVEDADMFLHSFYYLASTSGLLSTPHMSDSAACFLCH